MGDAAGPDLDDFLAAGAAAHGEVIVLARVPILAAGEAEPGREVPALGSRACCCLRTRG